MKIITIIIVIVITIVNILLRTKDKLDLHYSMRGLLPEWWSGWDPRLEEVLLDDHVHDIVVDDVDDTVAMPCMLN